MNKSQFYSIVSKKINVPEREIKKVLLSIKSTLIDVLCKGQKVKFSNFGEFNLVDVKQRMVKNPITKRYFFTEKKKQIKFKISKNFKFSIK